MLIKEEAEPDFNDLSTVKNRLNEQSKLIMLLKESCDREIMQSKEQETRYAELEDKNFELQQEIEELRQKLLNSQARVADLSGEISRTFEAIRLKKPSGKDAGTQCHADNAKRMKESGTNTEYQWLYDQKEHTQLKQTYKEISEKAQKEQDELRDNLHIRRLQERLCMTEQMKYRLQQEFDAYKRHAKELLDTEKEINRALRRAFH
ncbi:unnamed protein product [Dicrocoelium dendriticum]|nr:unnamed protein product [Dicrocoelium dendriticum]